MGNGLVAVGRVVALVSLLAACGPGARAKEPESAAGIGPAPAAVEGPAPAEATEAAASPKGASAATTPSRPAETAPPPQAPPKRERIRLHNSCSKPMEIYLVRVSDSELQTSITNGSSTEERATDGDEVRLIGENNVVLHALKIEPSMKLVDVASSCAKLEGQ